MASYLYCVLRPARADALPPSLRGIGAMKVRSLSSAAVDPLEAWVGTISVEEFQIAGADRASNALLHNAVVDAALATGRTPIPARYGVWFPDDDFCVRALINLRQRLLEALDRVANAVEISVLVVPREASTSSAGRPSSREAGAGRRYLEGIREHAETAARRWRVVSAEADRVSAAIGKIVRAEQRSTDHRGIVSLAHLVSRDVLDDYRSSVASLRSAAGVKILLGEVRAPYSFAVLDEPGTGHDSSSLINNE